MHPFQIQRYVCATPIRYFYSSWQWEMRELTNFYYTMTPPRDVERTYRRNGHKFCKSSSEGEQCHQTCGETTENTADVQSSGG